MADTAGNALTAEARDALETDKRVRLCIGHIPKWVNVEVLGGVSADVGLLQAQLRGGSRLVFRKEALVAVHIGDDEPEA
jgi:hypothetical protein